MYSLKFFLWTAFLAFLPVSELRGAIPFAIIQGLPWYWACPFAVLVNILVAPACWIFLSTLHRLLSVFSWYEKLAGGFLDRAREKLSPGVEKYGWFGVAIFVAIPLPLTGAWTGTMGAWVLGLSRIKTLTAVILGVTMAGAIVTAVMVLGIEALNFLVKKV